MFKRGRYDDVAERSKDSGILTNNTQLKGIRWEFATQNASVGANGAGSLQGSDATMLISFGEYAHGTSEA